MLAQIPDWLAEVQDGGRTNDWIQRGQCYADGLRLWRAQLRSAAASDTTGGEGVVHALQNHTPRSAWDRSVIRYLLSCLRGDSGYRYAQAAIKFASVDACTTAQRLGAAIDLARSGLVVFAVDAIKQLVECHQVSEQDCLEVCALLIANLQAASSVGVRDLEIDSAHWWLAHLAMQLQSIRVLATAVETASNEQNRTALASQLEILIIRAAEANHGSGVDEWAAIELLKKREQRMLTSAHEKPLLRTIHHLACTGGTVISKCLAAMPHVALISEVNPFNRFGSEFEPTNPLLQLERSYRKLDPQDVIEEFTRQVAHAHRICQQDNVDLIIRDHSHTDFCMGTAPRASCPLADYLSSDYDLLSVITVRHPLDSYLGMLAQGWEKQFTPSTLDEYSRRYLSFIERYVHLPLLRYEDFCSQPEDFMRKLCGMLKISYSSSFLGRFGAIALSGDSGRKGLDSIEPRPRRAVPESLNVEIESSESYSQLLAKLGY